MNRRSAPRTTGSRSSRACSTARSTASPPTTRLTHGTRRTRPSRRPRSASPGSRPRSGRCTPSSCARKSPRDPARAALGRPGARSRPARPRIAVGEPANLVLLDLDAEWTCGCVPLALGQLVAAGRLRRRGREDGRAGGWCSRRERACAARPTARGRHRVPRALGRGRGDGLRRGRVHDRHDRLPGDGHRPQLRRAARLLRRRWSATTAWTTGGSSRRRRTPARC